MTSISENGVVKVRVANFCDIELPIEHTLGLGSTDIDTAVREIRRYADLPYVYLFSEEKRDYVGELLSKLASIRSPCYPYALFPLNGAGKGLELDLDDASVDIVHLDSDDPETVRSRIKAYAASQIKFDPADLKRGNDADLPESVDVLVVGAGITGIYAAGRLLKYDISVCVVEKEEIVGGIWSSYANETSQVNTSEAGYRLVEKPFRSNRDHSTTREILTDIAHLAKELTDVLYLNTRVDWIDKKNDGYHIKLTRNGETVSLRSKGVILAINDRVGTPREIQWPDQDRFKGEVITGISNDPDRIDWKGKKVAIVGMGAYAVENSRTALERGAAHVTVVGRRHGTVCPKIIDYLNFATPYDEEFKHDKKAICAT